MQQEQRIRKRLRIVQVVALIDLVLLVTLVTAAVTRQQNIVHVLGPIHGINYLLLVVIVGTAALDGLWGWWFPLIVLVTGGPPGAFIGEWLLRRRISLQQKEGM